MNLLMIDDRGELLTGDVVRRRMSFAAVHSTDEFSAYVVKNMGFIALDLYGRSCQIRCRPSILSQPSLERLAAWLASAPADRFALCPAHGAQIVDCRVHRSFHNARFSQHVDLRLGHGEDTGLGQNERKRDLFRNKAERILCQLVARANIFVSQGDIGGDVRRREQWLAPYVRVDPTAGKRILKEVVDPRLERHIFARAAKLQIAKAVVDTLQLDDDSDEGVARFASAISGHRVQHWILSPRNAPAGSS